MAETWLSIHSIKSLSRFNRDCPQTLAHVCVHTLRGARSRTRRLASWQLWVMKGVIQGLTSQRGDEQDLIPTVVTSAWRRIQRWSGTPISIAIFWMVIHFVNTTICSQTHTLFFTSLQLIYTFFITIFSSSTHSWCSSCQCALLLSHWLKTPKTPFCIIAYFFSFQLHRTIFISYILVCQNCRSVG